MEVFLIKAAQLVFALCILVLIHEFGHYLFARIFGVKVEKFYLFFNPWFSIMRYDPRKRLLSLFTYSRTEKSVGADGKEQETEVDCALVEMGGRSEVPQKEGKATWRDTVYGLGWVPLGGYCAIAGMVDETHSADELAKEPQKWEFRAKPAWQRLLIMVGGVLFNFILATVIYAGIVYSYGEKEIPLRNATEGMTFCDSAHKLGFVDGDIPLFADDTEINDLSTTTVQAIFDAKTVRVLRNHQDTVTINIPENYIFTANEDAEKGQMFMIYRMPVVVAQTLPRGGADKAGMKEGDRVVAINNTPAATFDVFKPMLEENRDKTVTLTIIRDGKTIEIPVEVDGTGKIGFGLAPITEAYESVSREYGILQSIPRGIEMGWEKLSEYVSSMKYVFTKDGAQSLGGFGSIGNIFPESWSWYAFWNITAFLSVILAFMNIIPLPALDGGHVLFLLVEVITRRKLSDKFLERAQMVGMFLLLALLLFANGNDIYRFFIK